MKTIENSGEGSSIKKIKLHDSIRVEGSTVSSRLSGLPDEVLCHILSFISLRDSVRARSLSSRWRYLSAERPGPALHFDVVNVLGSEHAHDKRYQSEFVRAVDQFLDTWKGRSRLTSFKVRFCLGNKHASHIDAWVQTAISMGIKDLELNFSPTNIEEYVLSHELLTASLFKCLRLSRCVLTFSPGCTSWISRLTILELSFVPLNEFDGISAILSAGLNLIELRLYHCCMPIFPSELSLNVGLPRLKKLDISDCLTQIELNCPKLETFVCRSRVGNFKFSHVPVLTKVSMSLIFHPRGCVLIFDGLARDAPMLQELSLRVMTEVQPLPAYYPMTSLKRLHLDANVPSGFDLFTITYLLNASPFLETLHLELRLRDYTKKSPERVYSDHPHLKLKEVKIEGFQEECNEMKLAQYLLKNAVALQRMVIANGCPCHLSREAVIRNCDCSPWRQDIATTLLRESKTTPELVILGLLFNHRSNVVENGICPPLSKMSYSAS